MFFVELDNNGNVIDNILYSKPWEMEDVGEDTENWKNGLSCTIKEDGTISVSYAVAGTLYHEQYKGTLTIPDKISNYTVSELVDGYVLKLDSDEEIERDDGFCDSGAKKVVIPETVQTIGQNAFAGSGFLEEVEFSGNSQLKLIDQCAFQDCRSLKSITIPAGVETIAKGAFGNSEELKISGANSPIREDYGLEADLSDKYSLTDVKFAEGSKLKTIGEFAFSNQKSLTSIAIPESTDSIANNAFEGSALKNIDGVAGSYAETFAKENDYTFNGEAFEKPDDTSTPDDTSEPDDTPTTFTDDSGDKAADVQVIAKPNVIPKEAHFSVRLDDANTTAERIAYNCYFTYNGAEYEPTDTVTVRIPVPVAMRDIASTLKVYHLQDGKYVNMSAKVEDGYLVFDTDHFSVYVVTAENLENGGTSTPTSSDTASNDPTDPNKGNPDTGVAAIATAIGVVALAGAAVIITKKRK